MGRGLRLSSGRLIAVGRLLLAALFIVAIWLDSSQPARGPAATYALLLFYVVFAAAMLAATWNNWWLDSRLAGPAHGVDIALFTLLVLSTEGYTSPFFTFFIFLLLAAAIRWSWHATAFTAILLVLLFMVAGLIVVGGQSQFELQRFLVRTGHLVILSLILLWFGVNRWGAQLHGRNDDLFGQPAIDLPPDEPVLRAAMKALRAGRGIFVWRSGTQGDLNGIAIADGEPEPLQVPGYELAPFLAASPLLYDVARDRALSRDDSGNLVDSSASGAIGARAAERFRLDEGVAIPVRTSSGEGAIFLEAVKDLSTDHVDLGAALAADVAFFLQRHALLRATARDAESRSRLALARDLHDSVVQFLAGAGFRLEAMKRSAGAGNDVAGEIDELKQLMLHEQGELRSFIGALRSGSQVGFDELAADLKALAERLSRQWDVACELTARRSGQQIPTRLQLDAQQIVREAVANAVRHAGAKNVRLSLSATADELRIKIVNDGSAPKLRGGQVELPVSLQERVGQAGGTLDISRGMDVTKVAVALPLGRERP